MVRNCQKSKDRPVVVSLLSLLANLPVNPLAPAFRSRRFVDHRARLPAEQSYRVPDHHRGAQCHGATGQSR